MKDDLRKEDGKYLIGKEEKKRLKQILPLSLPWACLSPSAANRLEEVLWDLG